MICPSDGQPSLLGDRPPACLLGDLPPPALLVFWVTFHLPVFWVTLRLPVFWVTIPLLAFWVILPIPSFWVNFSLPGFWMTFPIPVTVSREYDDRGLSVYYHSFPQVISVILKSTWKKLLSFQWAEMMKKNYKRKPRLWCEIHYRISGRKQISVCVTAQWAEMCQKWD
jgi:hypothetical protein